MEIRLNFEEIPYDLQSLTELTCHLQMFSSNLLC